MSIIDGLQVEEAQFTTEDAFEYWIDAFGMGWWPDETPVDLGEAQANAIGFASFDGALAG
jgi:hypothetical protein